MAGIYKYTVLLYVLILLSPCSGEWERTYGDMMDNYGFCVIPASDEGYIIAGCREGGPTNIYLVKTNLNGDELWTKTIRCSGTDRAHSIVQAHDEGYVVCGYTSSFTEDHNDDIYIIKIDMLGDTVWTRTYGGPEDDGAYSIAQTSDSGYIVAGFTWSYGSGSEDFWVLKLDIHGDTIWARTYGGSSGDRCYSITQTTDGGYAIVGNSASFVDRGDAVWIVKADSEGDTIFTRTIGRVYALRGAFGLSVSQTLDGGYIVSGVCDIWGMWLTPRYLEYWEEGDILLSKLDENGNEQWLCTYGDVGDDAGFSVIQSSDGGYVVCGYGQFTREDSTDVCVIKTNEMGDTLWTRRYGGTGWDLGYSITETDDKGFIISGCTRSFGEGEYDIYLIKTDSLGFTTWIREIPVMPDNFSIITYPNPFNSVVNIRIQGVTPDFYRERNQVEIFDINGRVVSSWTSGFVGAFNRPGFPDPQITQSPDSRITGSSVYSWQPSLSIPSGIYFIKFTNKERLIKTHKIMYLK